MGGKLRHTFFFPWPKQLNLICLYLNLQPVHLSYKKHSMFSLTKVVLAFMTFIIILSAVSSTSVKIICQVVQWWCQMWGYQEGYFPKRTFLLPNMVRYQQTHSDIHKVVKTDEYLTIFAHHPPLKLVTTFSPIFI